MHKLILASNNAAKIKEFQALLSPLSINIIPQSELNVPEVEEPFTSFIENALLKARHASKMTGLPALADDSGLCVRALQGAPGVYSARFAGEPKSDANNNAKLLHTLADTTDRFAYYYAVLVLVRSFDDPQPLIADGLCAGEILTHPQGSGGFGYDPIFWIPDLERSAAELSFAEKNTIGHRGKALRALLGKLKETL